VTRAELGSLGLTDAILAKEIRRVSGQSVELIPGDGERAQGRRRDAFDYVTGAWAGDEKRA
jgi:hypothetical protein